MRIPLIFILILSSYSFGQEEPKVNEIQTFYHSGRLKTVEKNAIRQDGGLLVYSKFDVGDNSLYLHKKYLDSIQRTVKEITILDGEVIDSVHFSYSESGLKIQKRISPHPYFPRQFEEWVTYFNHQDLPIKETWTKLTIFEIGDPIKQLISEKKSFYNEENQLVLDSVFSSGAQAQPRIVNGTFSVVEKINSATVTHYSYNGKFLVNERTIDEYGNVRIVNHVRNEDGDYIQHDQLAITGKDTTCISQKFEVSKKGGKKVITQRGSFSSGYSKTFYNRQEQRTMHASYMEDGKMISKTEYKYNKEGLLIEETYHYLIDQKPINIMSDDPMGYRKVYFYE